MGELGLEPWQTEDCTVCNAAYQKRSAQLRWRKKKQENLRSEYALKITGRMWLAKEERDAD